jgi:methylmalonyl-CoA decarboxylase subunit alpha
MGLTEDRIRDFEQRQAQLVKMGGEKMIFKQHELGKLTAREILDLLFDKGTFQEVQLFVKHRSTLFGLAEKEINADAVITGYGKINGRIVFTAAQDFTSAGGSLGEMHAKKIWKVMDYGLRLYPSDHRNHGTVSRWGRLFASSDGLGFHGQGKQLYVHHWPRRYQSRHW